MAFTLRQRAIQQKGDKLHDDLVASYLDGKRVAVVKAPPGSGKTFMLLRVIATLVEEGWRVAIATQTNTQSDDLCLQCADHEVLKNFALTRLAAAGSNPPAGFPDQVAWVEKVAEAPEGPGLVIATTAKWATLSSVPAFSLFAIDEAWQMKWADMMLCSAVSDKYLLIGDPGQIPPVTNIDVARWGTSNRPPNRAVPDVVLEKMPDDSVVGSLPAVRRLPMASVDYVKPFYDFDFEAFAEQDDRQYLFTGQLREGSRSGVDTAACVVLENLRTFEPILATIPTPDGGPPAENDKEIALAVRRLCSAMLHMDVRIALNPGDEPRLVTQADIGVSATHRAQIGLIRKTLGSEMSDIRIDTPERWQGLQKPFMIAVHPLSGVLEPADFDLHTGRLCVMASRHQIGLILLSRDHLSETVANTVTFATQAPGQPDEAGRGRTAHANLLEMLQRNKRVISLPSMQGK
jgi:hypothetical protein